MKLLRRIFPGLNRGEPEGTARGQGMVEYGLIVSMVAILIISIMIVLGPSIERMFSDVIDSNARGERAATLSTSIYN